MYDTKFKVILDINYYSNSVVKYFNDPHDFDFLKAGEGI